MRRRVETLMIGAVGSAITTWLYCGCESSPDNEQLKAHIRIGESSIGGHEVKVVPPVPNGAWERGKSISEPHLPFKVLICDEIVGCYESIRYTTQVRGPENEGHSSGNDWKIIGN